MKVAVQCESPLLQRSLELFLADHLSSLKQCDVVVRDKKSMDSHHSLYISAEGDSDLKKPFSRSQLYLALENFYKNLLPASDELMEHEDFAQSTMQKDISILEQRLDQLTEEYKANVLKVVRAFYE